MTASSVPTLTVSPSGTLIETTFPPTGEGTSVSTLSVEISNSGSSRSTVSPSFFSHLVMVPSTTVSPSCGMVTEVATEQPPSIHIVWRGLPASDRKASPIPSDSVGCGWISRATSAGHASQLYMRVASAISSVTCGPTMCTPSTGPSFSATTFTRPPSPTMLAVDLHVPAVELDPPFLVPDSPTVGSPPNRYQAHVRSYRLGLLPLGLVGDLHVVTGILHAGHLHAGERFDPLLLEGSRGLPGEILVLQRRDARQGLQHGDLGAERRIDRGELQTDGSGPDDHHRGGEFLPKQRLIAGDDPVGDLEGGQKPRVRTGGEHHGGRPEGSRVDFHGRAGVSV